MTADAWLRRARDGGNRLAVCSNASGPVLALLLERSDPMFARVDSHDALGELLFAHRRAWPQVRDA